ncbi:hypothetical protein HYR54_09295 [Candidatus Acetothermia bacterium]|nr:hypothetical protein [Candidatus Acetothermia bacterium]
MIWTSFASGGIKQPMDNTPIPSVPGSTYSSDGVCQAQITFTTPGPREIQLTASNRLGDKGTAVVQINVAQVQGLSAQILSPYNGQEFTITKGSGNIISLQGASTITGASSRVNPAYTPPPPISSVHYDWYWYPRGGGVNSKKQIGTGSTVAWKPEDSGLCQQLYTPQDVTIRLEVFDPLQGSGFAEVKIRLSCLEPPK